MTDQSKARSSKHRLEVSEDVDRIASGLLGVPGNCAARPVSAFPNRRRIPVAIDEVASLVRARKLRNAHFSQDLFADPAWDMLLALTLAELSDQRMPVTRLCEASGVPTSTALRWLNTLIQKNLAVRRQDRLDSRRIFVELTPEASLRMRNYFRDVHDQDGG